MLSLPTFLSSFTWSLPSFPTISLPANIQRRFLSYVLKRSLGRFVRAGGLDVERIQAQIGEGRVEIEGLEVNVEEINSLIPPSLPFQLVGGSIELITARLPIPNLWSAPLSILLDTLTLELLLVPPRPDDSSGSGGSDDFLSPPTSPGIDLTSSVTSAADDFLHDELDAYEEAELDRSIRQSIVFNQIDPFNQDEKPGAFPGGYFPSPPAHHASASNIGAGKEVGVESTTVLAGLIERILARLEFRVNNIRVRIRHEDSKHGGTFELRIGEVQYADESPTTEGDRGQTVRVVRMSNVNLFAFPPDSAKEKAKDRPAFFAAARSVSSSSSCSSTSTTSTDSSGTETMGDNMLMSMAVADLRESMATSASGASIYASAYSEAPQHEDRSTGEPPHDSTHIEGGRGQTPTPPARSGSSGSAKKDEDGSLLFSFGSEDIVLRMTTTRPNAQPAVDSATSDRRPRSQVPADRLPSINIDLSLGTIAAVILPSQAATILSALQLATKPAHSTTSPSIASNVTPALQPRFEAAITVKSVFASVIYDLDAATSPELIPALASFWSRPGQVDVPVGHLKFRLDGLSAKYASIEQDSPRRDIHVASRGDLSRRTSTKLIPRSPKVSISLQDASIFEYLAAKSDNIKDDDPPGGCFPVLLFDTNLLKQYEMGPLASASLGRTSRTTGTDGMFPDFEGIDWRNSGLQRRGTGIAAEKVWKVKPKGRGVLKGATPIVEDSVPAIVITKEMSPSSAGSIEVQPIHFFLDLSLLERLLPMLRHISPAVKRTDTSPASPIISHRAPSFRTPKKQDSVRPPMPARRSESYVLDDLDAEAERAASHPTAQGVLAIVKCPMIRLSIRCPAPVNRRGTWGDGAHLRSGIVTLDLHGIHARLATDGASKVPARSATIGHMTKPEEGTKVSWTKMILFFSRTPCKSSIDRRRQTSFGSLRTATKSSAFLIVGPLSHEAGDGDASPLRPSVAISSTSSSTGYREDITSKTTLLNCQIPSVQAKIHQRTIEGLQFFADDLTHWLDGAFGDGSRPKPRDELKMIGSRFFGSKASSSAGSEILEDEVGSGTLIRVLISETNVVLHVPRKDAPPTTSSLEAKEGGKRERILAVRASDLDLELQSNTSGQKGTNLILSIMDVDFSDNTSGTASRRILGRTTPLSLATQNHPVVHLRFSSLTDPDSDTKETDIKAILSSFTVSVTDDIGWAQDLALFVKTPEGVFEDVVPSEVTRISVEVYDGSIHLSAPSHGGAMVVVLGALEVGTEIVGDAVESLVEMSLNGGGVLALDDARVGGAISHAASSFEVWKNAGYAQLVEICELEVQFLRDLKDTQEMLLDVLSVQVRVTACADSLAAMGPLVADLSKIIPQKPSLDETPLKSPVSLDQSVDVFASIDEDAFNRIPDMISGVDLIEDDLPTNLDYLDHATRRVEPQTDKMTGETLRSWQTTGEGDFDAKIHSEVNGETLKMLYSEPFEVDEQYWENLTPVSRGGTDPKDGKIRVRVHQCAVNVLLYEGYDWQKTRKAIEDEIKTMRRKLEKIRQLLASGQKADESVDIDATRSVLFNSVYIGLDQSRDMDSAALLAAIDEELGDMNDNSSISSWQTNFPAGHPAQSPPMQHGRTKTRLKGKRLTRSKKPQIEIALAGVKADLDVYGKDVTTAMRVTVSIAALEILDHIKTSTWKKFLTEMKSDSRGNVRETDADMIKIEVTGVRPLLPSLEEEYRLKAKILPLRLHVDQDALDFLKRFFSFTTPGQGSASTGGAAQAQHKEAEPFFQHVEIYPIELKLDYKPKRVDFAALREGKTIELMNFFHFDGAEMTLRHITLSGISGITRLSNLLQDIWTPDVKANQLADVISGVSPIRSMVNVGSGVADLILLPIEQYRKDGRLARGVQRGTNSFVRSTALEMMKLGAKLATGTQVILERAEGVLSGKPGDAPVVVDVRGAEEGSSEDEEEVVSRYANQPGGAREGVQMAYASMAKNVNAAAQTILAVPMEVYERSGDNGPLRAVVRAVPIAVLKPMIGASEAVSKTLLGVRNSLDPKGREELGDKYK